MRVPQRLGELGARLDTPSGSEWVRRAAWTVVALAFLAFVVRGATRPADPFLAGTTERVLIDGFDEVSFTVTDAHGTLADWCAMLADTPELRELGLMHQHDLGGYDGMVFRYDTPSDGSFWMKNTIIPLAVAYFDETGAFINAQGMDPCPESAETCPSYPPARRFQYAIEVPRGGLGRLGIGEGARVTFTGKPCP
jgi:uncharacterized membrane protein (UPF0127 family)